MRLEIFLKYASNILKFKNFPKHGEAREPFKNIFCILIKKKECIKRLIQSIPQGVHAAFDCMSILNVLHVSH